MFLFSKFKIDVLIACFLSSMIFYGCTKEDSQHPETLNNITPLKGFEYFLNTNEVWYYKIENLSPGYWVYITYKIERDTVIGLNSIEIPAKIFSQKYKRDGPYIDGVDHSNEGTIEIVIYYDKENRVLQRLNTDRSDIGNFNKLQNSANCKNQITRIDTINIGENQYTRFVNFSNQEIIEGISLGVDNCAFYPPTESVNPTLHVFKEVSYTSDEFSYLWKN